MNDALILLAKVNVAISAAVLLVLVLRGTMRRWFGARAAYALWLCAPLAAAAAVLPAREKIVERAPVAVVPATAVISAGAGTNTQAAAVAPADLSLLLAITWLAGFLATAGLLAWRQRAFVRSLGRLTPEGRGVLRAEARGLGPALIGAVRPKLILPQDFEARFDAAERDVVLAHERMHLKGGDPLVNALTALTQCICWFNPLAHVAARTMRIDQELACDAAVVAKFPSSKFPGARKRYAEAMLKTQFVVMNLPLGCYWPARGADPLKQRIAMLKRDLPSELRAAWGAVLVALVCMTSGCVVWIAQPPREVEAANRQVVAPISPEQAGLDADLLRAIWRGDARGAESAITSGADVNTRTGDGTTALVIAARADDLRNVSLLLQHGADPNLHSPGEGNALAAAARRGQLRSVAALVEHGAEINRLAPGWGTPLAAAVRTTQLPVVKYLVEHGADVNLVSPAAAPWDRWGADHPPLWWAVNNGDRSVIEYLKSRGATM